MSGPQTEAGKALLDESLVSVSMAGKVIRRAVLSERIAAIEAEARASVVLAHDAWSMEAVREWLQLPGQEGTVAAALIDLFPLVQRSRWPFTEADVARAILAALLKAK